VYSFTQDEMWVLKLLSFLLYHYNDHQPDGVYSFRLGAGVHRAINKIVHTPNIKQMWCYKVDIADYFNSVTVKLLLPILREVFNDDPLLYEFFARLLDDDRAVFEGHEIRESRGVMAGTPLAPFLANFYLRELDHEFVTTLATTYARYSDDIIIFGKSEAEIVKYRARCYEILGKYKLHVNTGKETLTAPGESWEFLGIEFDNGTIDLSGATKMKIKGKISRKARALRRWYLKKGESFERAQRAMIKVFNRKFFDARDSRDLTWARWFFPLVTRADGLHEIDLYLQQYIRYIPTGKHHKKNFVTSYDDLKKMGYKSLVHEYHQRDTMRL
jgi:hypothetical protein